MRDIYLNHLSSQMSETSFNIAIPDEKLALLRQKLELTTFPDELEGSGWEYGVPLKDVRRLVEKWKNGFDWRAQEAQINSELPQFTRDIEVNGHGTLNIHYVHKKSTVVGAIPLLFVHGCKFLFSSNTVVFIHSHGGQGQEASSRRASLRLY